MKIKGTAIRSRIEYLRQHHGESGLEDVVAALQPEHQQLVRDSILITEWYPFELSEDLLGCAERLLGKADGSLCEAIGSASCRRGITSVYSVFAGVDRETSIAEYASRKTHLMWKVYYDRGQLLGRATGTHSIEYEMSGVSVATRWLCHILTGYNRTYIEMLGGKDVQNKHVKCRTRKDPRCLWLAHWK